MCIGPQPLGFQAMLIEPELGSANIVLRGNFNPTIMQPMWLARHEVISDEAAENAVVEVIHPEITAFTIDSLFTLRVEREGFKLCAACRR